jgi:hypothetical protein
MEFVDTMSSHDALICGARWPASSGQKQGQSSFTHPKALAMNVSERTGSVIEPFSAWAVVMDNLRCLRNSCSDAIFFFTHFAVAFANEVTWVDAG